MLERWFRLSEHGTTVRTEVLAGITTFLTMAYIIFVQPGMLSATGMDGGAVLTATCIASALGTLLMAIWAKYPVALAPGMGANAYFAFVMVPALAERGFGEDAWKVGLGVIFLSGLAFLVLTAAGVRQAILNAISPSLKNAIAVGIGLFIAFIGLKNTGLIVGDDATLVRLNPALQNPDTWVFFAGLLVAAALYVWRVPGSILWGIVAATALAVVLKLALPADAASGSQLGQSFKLAQGVVAAPPSILPTLGAMDLAAAVTATALPFVLVFLFIDMFDTMGTLIGVAEEAGLMKDGQLPRAGAAMGSDAIATAAGAVLGTSTVTSYIESTAGVEIGGRTGLVGVVVAIGFILALFFAPVIAMVGSYAPITAPALVLVGAMMARNVVRIAWNDMTEALPAFFIMLGIPLSFSIGDGIALGFIVYPLMKLLTGKVREVGPVMWITAALLAGYFVFRLALT